MPPGKVNSSTTNLVLPGMYYAPTRTCQVTNGTPTIPSSIPSYTVLLCLEARKYVFPRLCLEVHFIVALHYLQADRTGKALDFAASYDKSEQKKEVVEQLARYSGEIGQVSKRTMEALTVSRATSTPFWWGIWTLLRVRPY